MPPEPWDGALVSRLLQNTRFAGRVHHAVSVPSTNTLAIDAAHVAAPAYSVWVADEQTAGRGRGGHAWHSEPGTGLYLSVLLRPRMEAGKALWLSLAAGLAVQAAMVAITGSHADIRWPNDLLLEGRKFAGILVESATGAAVHAGGPGLRYAVIGIGLNAGHGEFAPELEPIATSLFLATGRLWPRERLLAAVLLAIADEVDRLEGELSLPAREERRADSILDRFARASSWVQGKSVQVAEAGGYTGVTAGLDERGFLRVVDASGNLHTVLSGGVREVGAGAP